jgi:hypothetical protein
MRISEPYLLQKWGYFYRHNSSGYTSSPFEAELFTESEAIEYTENHEDVSMVAITKVLAADKAKDYFDRIEVISTFYKQNKLTEL